MVLISQFTFLPPSDYAAIQLCAVTRLRIFLIVRNLRWKNMQLYYVHVVIGLGSIDSSVNHAPQIFSLLSWIFASILIISEESDATGIRY